MGDIWSCPCVNRKEMERKVICSKFDDYFKEQYSKPGDKELLALKLRREKDLPTIITNNDSVFKKFMIKRSTSQVTLSPFNFSEETSSCSDIGLVAVCEVMDDFGKFHRKYSQIYNSINKKEMAPTFIIPHPFMRKGIVIFQPLSSVKFQTNNYIEFKKIFKDIAPKEAYKELQNFFREKFSEGYNYIGYYLDIKQNYHFVFAPGSRSDESAGLRFEVINSLNSNGLESVCQRAVERNYKLLGVVTLMFQGNNFIFGIFEKVKLNLEEIMIMDIPANSLGHDNITSAMTQKINFDCQAEGFELAGLIPDYQSRLVYLVLSQ